MKKISCAYTLYYELPSDFFDDVYVEVIKEIIKTLNENGRCGERITWTQGDFIPGEDFPLDPRYGPGTHLRIIGYCYIPEKRTDDDSNTDIS